jgi:hypothetical protein
MRASNFARIETANCPCRKFLASLKDVADRHQHYFGHARLTSMTPVVDSRTSVEVLVVYDSSVGGIRDASDKTVSTSAARTGVTELFFVTLSGDRGLVRGITVVHEGRSG